MPRWSSEPPCCSRSGAVEVVISPPVPEHLAEERDAIDRGRRIAGGHLRRDSEEIERTGCADVGRVVRIWIDILEGALGHGQSHRAVDVVGSPKEFIEARVDRGAVVRAAVKVTRSARGLAVATQLNVPEQCLAQTDGRRLVDDVTADRHRNGNARERP